MDGLYFHHHQLVVGVEGQLQGKVWRKERLAFVWKKLFGECFLDLESMRKALLRLERRKAWGMFWLMKAGLVCFGGEVWAFRGLKIKRKTSILKKGVYFENRRLFWKKARWRLFWSEPKHTSPFFVQSSHGFIRSCLVQCVTTECVQRILYVDFGCTTHRRW